MQVKLLNTDASIPNFKGKDKQMHTMVVKPEKHLHPSQFPAD